MMAFTERNVYILLALFALFVVFDSVKPNMVCGEVIKKTSVSGNSKKSRSKRKIYYYAHIRGVDSWGISRSGSVSLPYLQWYYLKVGDKWCPKRRS